MPVRFCVSAAATIALQSSRHRVTDLFNDLGLVADKPVAFSKPLGERKLVRLQHPQFQVQLEESILDFQVYLTLFRQASGSNSISSLAREIPSAIVAWQEAISPKCQ